MAGPCPRGSAQGLHCGGYFQGTRTQKAFGERCAESLGWEDKGSPGVEAPGWTISGDLTWDGYKQGQDGSGRWDCHLSSGAPDPGEEGSATAQVLTQNLRLKSV